MCLRQKGNYGGYVIGSDRESKLCVMRTGTGSKAFGTGSKAVRAPRNRERGLPHNQLVHGHLVRKADRHVAAGQWGHLEGRRRVRKAARRQAQGVNCSAVSSDQAQTEHSTTVTILKYH